MNDSQSSKTPSTTVKAASRSPLIHEPVDGDPSKITLVRARGASVWDDQGREYLDCTSQAWSNNLGANDPRVIDAAIAQLREIVHARPNFNTLPLLTLTAKLRDISPGDLNRIGYCLHGSLAIEMAIKLAFKNKPDRHNIIVLQDAYHGRSLTTMAASWPHPKNAFLPVQPRFTRVPHPDPYRPRLNLDVEADSRLCLQLLEDTISKGGDGGGAGGGFPLPGTWQVEDSIDLKRVMMRSVLVSSPSPWQPRMPRSTRSSTIICATRREILVLLQRIAYEKSWAAEGCP